MARKTFILFAGDDAWRVGTIDARGPSISPISIPPSSTPNQLAAQCGEALGKVGHGASPIVLAVPSSWCVAASIRIDDLPKADAKSLLYRLEEKLPWPAESIVADFIRGEKSALGVCIRIERVRAIIDALEENGIAVQTITPTALLAVDDASDIDLSLIELNSGQQVDLITLGNGRPTSWALSTSDPADIALQKNLLLSDLPQESAQKAVGENDYYSAAIRAAQSIMNGTRAALVDFRRGELAAPDKLRLHRRPLNALLATAAVFLIALTSAFVWRAHQYQHRARTSQQQLADAFVAQFPGWDVPANVKAVIESEHRRLISAPTSALPPEATTSALPTFYALLSQFPADTAINVQRLTASFDSIDIDAQLRNYEDADAIATAARKAGLEVPPPQVRKETSGIWSLTLHATRLKPLAEAQK